MANWQFVLAYDQRFAQHELADKGLPHPPVCPENRMPTFAEIRWAIAQQPTWVEDDRWLPDSLEVREDRDEANSCRLIIEGEGIGWVDTINESFHMRGDLGWELDLVRTLCQRCGQLYVYFDSGHPPIILDSASDVRRIEALWHEAVGHEDSWERFSRVAYAQS